MNRGQILFLQKSGLYVVPFDNKGDGYTCVVVKGNKIYPVGGYHIFVHISEIDLADRYIVEGDKLVIVEPLNIDPMPIEPMKVPEGICKEEYWK